MSRPQLPIQHGTNAGYHAECKRGLPTCDACRQAHREYRKAVRHANLQHDRAVKRRSQSTYNAALQRLAKLHRSEFRAILDEIRQEAR